MKRTVFTLTIAITILVALFAIPALVGPSFANSKEALSFNKDVAPILFNNCSGCHRPGESAPMSLLSYKDARPWARAIREKVVRREMPPWHADPRVGEFANDRRLTQRQIDTIAAWVDGGAVEGDSRHLPPVPKFTDGWSIGKPDLILQMPEEFTLAADGPDEYRYFLIDPGFTEDKWVQMAEARPGNRRIVHHINVFVQPPSPADKPDKNVTRQQLEKMRFEQDKNSILQREGFLQRLKPDVPVFDEGCQLPSGGAGIHPDGSGQRVWPEWLGGFVPGINGLSWQAGTAKKIRAGSKIVLNVHYSRTTGKVETDRSIVGLTFAKQRPEKQVFTQLIVNHYFRIPPGVRNHVVSACWTAKEDIHVVCVAPHMHYRGKAMEIKAVYPGGRSQVLVHVPEYSFVWQTMYYFKQPIAIPAGTRIVATAAFDNSTANKYNPDPSQAVRWGDPTSDEMMMSILEYTPDGKPPRTVDAGRGSAAVQR